MIDRTEQFVAEFEQFRMPPTAIDRYHQGGRDNLVAKLRPFIEAGQPVPLLMLGYPFKSLNTRDKTLGKRPDLGEELSMKNFARFGEHMKQVHPPGVHLVIASDGHVFSELLGETSSTVEAYAEEVTDMGRGGPVELLGLRDFYPTLPHLARERMMKQWNIGDVELKRRVLVDPNTTALFSGMIRFMEQELAIRSFVSKRQLHLAAKELARKMMLFNEAYSHLVAAEFPQSIRLSMHNTTNDNKWGFQLIPSPRAEHSPWHCALVLEADGTPATMHRRDAEARGAELVYREGRPYYFQLR